MTANVVFMQAIMGQSPALVYVANGYACTEAEPYAVDK